MQVEGMGSAEHACCKGQFDGLSERQLNNGSGGKKILSVKSPAEDLEEDGNIRGREANTVNQELSCIL